MDSIVNKLSEIESAAVSIVEHAEAQKETLEKEMQEKRDRFDAELKADTDQKLSTIQRELELTMSQELEHLKAEHNKTMETLLQDYDAKHEAYAREIIKRITEV